MCVVAKLNSSIEKPAGMSTQEWVYYKRSLDLPNLCLWYFSLKHTPFSSLHSNVHTHFNFTTHSFFLWRLILIVSVSKSIKKVCTEKMFFFNFSCCPFSPTVITTTIIIVKVLVHFYNSGDKKEKLMMTIEWMAFI